ncbi:hypothetical protein [Ornithinimicrobium avium]|nr:hypothetical protein [Ornithinimicrobium avium]
MSITGIHIPHGDEPMAAVTVNERNAMSYYPYVQGGPVEAASVTMGGLEAKVYVNSRYPSLDDGTVNPRASALFEMAGIGMFGGAIRGDALLVLAAGDGFYERSVPQHVVSALLDADAQYMA